MDLRTANTHQSFSRLWRIILDFSVSIESTGSPFEKSLLEFSITSFVCTCKDSLTVQTVPFPGPDLSVVASC